MLVVVFVRFDSQFSNKKLDSHPSSTRSLNSATSFSRACSSPELSRSERAAARAAAAEGEEEEAFMPTSTFLFAFLAAALPRGSIASG